MQYFKHELFASHAFVETRRERAYRRSLRYGHARLGASREAQAPCPAPATLIALPRVQAVVDAMLAANSGAAQPAAARIAARVVEPAVKPAAEPMNTRAA